MDTFSSDSTNSKQDAHAVVQQHEGRGGVVFSRWEGGTKDKMIMMRTITTTKTGNMLYIVSLLSHVFHSFTICYGSSTICVHKNVKAKSRSTFSNGLQPY